MKKKKKLQLKLEQRERSDVLIRSALARAKKTQRETEDSGPRRKSAADLGRYIALPLEGEHCLRAADTFRTRTYSLDRQVMELVNHCFVRYPVPDFLWRTILSPDGRELVRRETKAEAAKKDRRRILTWERALFFAVANGQSVAKLMAGQLTKKECHLFLQAPAFFTASNAVEWARLIGLGLSRGRAAQVVWFMERRNLWHFLGPRRDDLYRALAGDPGFLNLGNLQYILDFVGAKLMEPDFSFRGRTPRSLHKLSEAWHRANRWGRLEQRISWARRIETWEGTIDGVRVQVREMCSNKELHEDSERMDHCVFTYAEDCARGYSSILAMRVYAVGNASVQTTQLTLEVDVTAKRVVQVRGRCNRRATPEEHTAIKAFASARGLTVSPWCW